MFSWPNCMYMALDNNHNDNINQDNNNNDNNNDNNNNNDNWWMILKEYKYKYALYGDLY